MRVFTIIAGVITVISFIIQLNDFFPNYKETFERITLVLLGVMIGLIISYFNKNNMQMKKLDSQQIFAFIFYGIIGIAFIVIFISILITDEKEKISTLHTVLGSLGAFTLVSFFFVLKFLYAGTGTSLYIDEKIALAEKYYVEKNFSRSLHFYMDLLDGLEDYDPRVQHIRKKISEIKIEQVTSKENFLNK